MAQNGRLIKELNQVSKDDGSGVQAQPVVEGNLRQLKGTIQGPAGTPYEGGVFEIDIQIGKQYPFEPPKMKYITKIWHPNISSQTGAICLVRVCRATDSKMVPSVLFGGSFSQSYSLKRCPFLLIFNKLFVSHLGYSERPVESSLDDQNCLAFSTSTHVLARSR